LYISILGSGDPRLLFLVSSSPLTQLDFIPFNSRYEDEINKRTAAENEFVKLKKVRLSQIRGSWPFPEGEGSEKRITEETKTGADCVGGLI